MQVSHKKLRFLITLHALYKHTDENHRLNSKKLNAFLKPYGVESSDSALRDTIEVLWRYGVGVKTHGVLNKHGVWLQDRPLYEAALKQLIFAITTNPLLSAEQQAELLESLNPLVTVYQEPLLHSHIQMVQNSSPLSGKQIEIYSTIHEAISTNKRVHIAKRNISRTRGENIQRCFFTPKCFQVTEKQIYALGYNHLKKEVEGIAITDIESAVLASRRKNSHEDMVRTLLDDVDPKNYIRAGV